MNCVVCHTDLDQHETWEFTACLEYLEIGIKRMKIGLTQSKSEKLVSRAIDDAKIILGSA